MKTAEIINNVCAHLGISKADLAKQMGIYPSSLYRKLSRDSMTFEELQTYLDALGVSLELEFHYQDGNVLSSQANHAHLVDRMAILEKELEASNKTKEFEKKSLRTLRTELYSALGYVELSKKQGSPNMEYMDKLQMVLKNMEKTIAYALGETLEEESDEIDGTRLEALAGKRVLLVEDNELNREILREMLEAQDLIIEEAEDGKKAIESVKEKDPGYFHFILMDVEMTQMDGYEATLKIRNLPNRIRANIPIIALTANAIPENRERAAAVGMDDFLVKPANSTRLLRSLAKFL